MFSSIRMCSLDKKDLLNSKIDISDVICDKNQKKVFGQKITMPVFTMASNSIIRLSDIKVRRFDIINRFQALSWQDKITDMINTREDIND